MYFMKDFIYLHILNKKGNLYTTGNLSNFSNGQTRPKITIECFCKTFLTNMHSDIFLTVKNKPSIQCWFLALFYAKGVLEVESCIDIAVLV